MSPKGKPKRSASGRPPTTGTTRSRAVMMRLTPEECSALDIVADAEARFPSEMARLIVAADPRVKAAMRRMRP
jgi:hypothetical protein